MLLMIINISRTKEAQATEYLEGIGRKAEVRAGCRKGTCSIYVGASICYFPLC